MWFKLPDVCVLKIEQKQVQAENRELHIRKDADQYPRIQEIAQVIH